MSRYLLDTNICVHLIKNEFDLKQRMAQVGPGKFICRSLPDKVQEAQQQAREQTQSVNDNQAQRYINPVTGQEMTATAYQKLQEFLERQKQREQERNAKKRDRGLEY